MSCFSFQDNTRVMRIPYKNLHQPVRSKEVFDTGILTCSYFTVSCKLPPKLKSIQEASVPPLWRSTGRSVFIPAAQWSVFYTLEEILPVHSTMLCLKRVNERARQFDCDREKEKGRKGTSLQNGRWQEDGWTEEDAFGKGNEFFQDEWPCSPFHLAHWFP